jgi:hypothetical protein
LAGCGHKKKKKEPEKSFIHQQKIKKSKGKGFFATPDKGTPGLRFGVNKRKKTVMPPKISKETKLETNRLILQFPSLEEAPLVMSATKFEGFNDGMLWDPPETVAPIIENYHHCLKAWEKGEAYCFSLVDKETEDFIGKINSRWGCVRRPKDFLHNPCFQFPIYDCFFQVV